MSLVWELCEENELEQGDLLSQCLVPVISDDFDLVGGEDDTVDIQFLEYDLIILTQTCDLVQGKTRKVALCQVHRLPVFEELNKGFTKKHLPNVRSGRQLGLYYLRLPPDQDPMPDVQEDGLIVDFREIYILPFAYVQRRASSLERRWGLVSPYREAFSQAFGHLFSRVAVP